MSWVTPYAYTPAYLLAPAAAPVSLTLPLRPAPYVERVLFPFFDGLVPEGWLLKVAEKNWKRNTRDHIGLFFH